MRAIVRPPGDSFAGALTSHPHAGSIDPERARSQHERYRRTLRDLGAEVIELPAEEAWPDSCFVEDCAVVLSRAALITRPGAPTRQPEVGGVEPVLSRLLERVASMSAPASLDGGDVLHLGKTLVAGRSARTNQAGIEQLAAFARSRGVAVVPMVVPDGVLHLQSAVTAVGRDAVVGDPSVLELAPFADILHRIAADDEEAAARNVLSIGREVLMPRGCPSTASALGALGYGVHELDLSEFHKADGGTTCLSILIQD